MEQILELSIYSMSIKLFEKKIHISLKKNGNHPFGEPFGLLTYLLVVRVFFLNFTHGFYRFFLVNARGIQLKFLDMPQ